MGNHSPEVVLKRVWGQIVGLPIVLVASPGVDSCHSFYDKDRTRCTNNGRFHRVSTGAWRWLRNSRILVPPWTDQHRNWQLIRFKLSVLRGKIRTIIISSKLMDMGNRSSYSSWRAINPLRLIYGWISRLMVLLVKRVWIMSSNSYEILWTLSHGGNKSWLCELINCWLIHENIYYLIIEFTKDYHPGVNQSECQFGMFISGNFSYN